MSLRKAGSGEHSRDRHKTVDKSKSKPTHRSKQIEPSKDREHRESPGVRGNDRSERTDRARIDARRHDRGALDKDSKETHSDPVGSREVVRQQADTARGMTGRGDADTPRFRAMADRGPDGSPANGLSPDKAASSSRAKTDVKDDADPRAHDGSPANDLRPEQAKTPQKRDAANDPIEREEKVGIRTPEAVKQGAKLPSAPDLSKLTPTDAKESDGIKVETYEEKGRKYTQTTAQDGTVQTEYHQGDVGYDYTKRPDGSTRTVVNQADDEGTHSRTVEKKAGGALESDTVASRVKTDDGRVETRTQVVDAALKRTTTEEVTRADGGESKLVRTEHPDKRVDETYNFKGDQGTLARTTNVAADGSDQTRVERTQRVDEPIENLVEEPKVPKGAGTVVPLPAGRRDDTLVTEVEVSTKRPGGDTREVQYVETQYSQVSKDLKVENPEDQKAGIQAGGAFSTLSGEGSARPDAQVTRTVKEVEARDPKTGRMVKSTGASQTVDLRGEREGKPGGKFSVSQTESWNSEGTSTTDWRADGFRRKESENWVSAGGVRDDAVLIGGERVSITPPVNDKDPGQHFRDNGDAVKFLGASEQDVVDLKVGVSRDAKGQTTGELVTYSDLDKDGNGRTVNRSRAADSPVKWTYSDFKNDGKDYKKQSVYAGTSLSEYEETTTTGPNTFKSFSETKDGDRIVSSKAASREVVTEADLKKRVTEGTLSPAQLERIKVDGPPYFLESSKTSAKAFLDSKGNPRTDEDGKLIQPPSETQSWTVANERGYSVSESSYLNPLEYTKNRLTSETDPRRVPPYTGTVIEEKRNPAGTYQEIARTGLTMDNQGKVMADLDGDGQKESVEVARYDLQGRNLSDVVADSGSLQAGPIAASLASVAGVGGAPIRFSDRIEITGGSKELDRLGKYGNIAGLGFSLYNTFNGVREGDTRAALANGVDTASAVSGLSMISKTGGGQVAAKVLGPIGGAFTVYSGLESLADAQSGADQAGAGLTVAGGALLVAAPFTGPLAPVVGGAGVLTSVVGSFVSASDDGRLVELDQRLS